MLYFVQVNNTYKVKKMDNILAKLDTIVKNIGPLNQIVNQISNLTFSIDQALACDICNIYVGPHPGCSGCYCEGGTKWCRDGEAHVFVGKNYNEQPPPCGPYLCDLICHEYSDGTCPPVG